MCGQIFYTTVAL